MFRMRPTWASVDLEALRRNYHRICKYTKSEVMAIVKANAYGHGAIEVVQALKEEGVHRFGVAILEEALQIREVFPDLSVMVIGPTMPEQAKIIVENRIIPEVFRLEQAEAFSSEALKIGTTAVLHIKIDTGMGRIGFREDALENILKIAKLPNIVIEGIYTHLATADETDQNFVREQLRKFDELYENLEAEGIRIPIRHVANSAGIMQLTDLSYELCRPGIVLYGQSPLMHVEGAEEFEPVMSLKANIVHLKEIAAGESVGYGRTFIAQAPTLVATLPIGYADGLRRSLSNNGEVIVKGKYAPIIGRICMDQTMVDVTGVEGVKIGDEVTIIGTEGNKSITAKQMADHADTISYEILCGLSQRVPREYINTR